MPVDMKSLQAQAVLATDNTANQAQWELPTLNVLALPQTQGGVGALQESDGAGLFS